jgi:endonuclease/exonuclease/phosphatase family metal-dependent hydrolase
VAGDFNTTAAMGDLKTLRGMLHDAASASSSVYPVSWNELWNLPLWRLDWAFTQHHVTVDSYALRKMGDRLSDHKAQILELTV